MRLRRLNLVVLATAWLTAACVQPGPRPVTPQRLSLPAVVDSVASTAPLHRTHWGVEVHDPAANQTLYRLNPEKHFIPASNNKLVVTAVALGMLGRDYRYTTDVFGLGFAPGETSADGLLVAGRGDPTLSERFHDSDFAPLDALADSVAAAGVRRIAGDLVVDATYFDSTLVHPAWEVGDLAWYYAAPVAAFAVGEGTVPVVATPGFRPGDPARLEVLAPPQAIAVRNRLVTDTADADRSFDVVHRKVPDRIAPDTIVLAGRLPVDAEPDTIGLAVVQPAAYAGRAFRAALEARGIDVDGRVRVLYDSARVAALRRTAASPPSRLATWRSPPLSEIVAAILEPSQNWIAEMLLKTLGARFGDEGSWSEGVDVEEEYLVDVAGIDSTAFYLRDASGLSAQNLLAPHAVVRLLLHARRNPWGPAYRRAMAKPGVEETTLERRLTALEGRVFAKTGTIRHVNALSGYLVADDGTERIFSILTNGSGRPASEVRRAIDRIVHAIAEEGGQR